MNAAENQWEWIEQTLAASTAQWLFVVGHYPGMFCESALYIQYNLLKG